MPGPTRFLMLALASFLLGGCVPGGGAQSSSSSLMAGRIGVGATVYKASQYDVDDITVTVPRTLIVSEANSYHPDADIVWRGDPVGDRYAQIEAILTEAAATGTVMMTKGPKVDVDLTLVRFHGVTEKTRYSLGGVHAMEFEITVRDASGAILDGPRRVIAETPAAGGAAAIAEDAAGLTQRVIVTARLARAIRSELSRVVSPPAKGASLMRASSTGG